MLGIALAAPAEKFMAEAEEGAKIAALSASVAANVISLIENMKYSRQIICSLSIA
jgi:hypothetical protein